MIRLAPCCLMVLLLAAVPSVRAQDSAAPANAPMRVSAGVMAGQLKTKVAPIYPPEAKAAQVQGAVVMHAIIGKTGDVEKLLVVSGPEALRPSALDAVRQWTYKPYLLNGNPVDMDTTITVNYSLNQPAPADLQGGVMAGTSTGVPPSTQVLSPPSRIRVSSGVMAGLIKTQTIPKFPEDAAHEVGAVVLRAVIDRSGKVIQLDRMSGPKILSQAIMDAVWQWTYKPYLINGEPVEVETQITINFSHGASV